MCETLPTAIEVVVKQLIATTVKAITRHRLTYEQALGAVVADRCEGLATITLVTNDLLALGGH
jgi:hypothetical protein